jgi:(4-(4-[2-(gamma-L-glutamylamino)ethyl]phenoxymethyl)furan-2-yl)methanamine synthase
MIFGWDLGGAHVKLAVLDNQGRLVRAVQAPCRLWLGPGELAHTLQSLGGADARDHRHAVTMTGELVDHFADRATGVATILETFGSVVAARDTLVFDGTGFATQVTARERWRDVASANWRATLLLAASLVDEALVLDIGSTTTDLMPVAGGQPVDPPQNDHERLAAGTLVYTGVVRTPLMALAHQVPFRGREVGVMAEYFATSGDLYRISGELDPAFDHADTADGRGKSKAESIARLARMVGLDANAAEAADWHALTAWFAYTQKELLRSACVRQLIRGRIGWNAPFVGLGVGTFLATKLAVAFDHRFVDFATLAGVGAEQAHAVDVCGPAYAVARLSQRTA